LDNRLNGQSELERKKRKDKSKQKGKRRKKPVKSDIPV
jgi:hypothetical protein